MSWSVGLVLLISRYGSLGRHGPPTPGPGMWMFTLGWVLASFITSVTSTPWHSQIRASWFAKAMFTSRKVFSASLAISAVVASVSITVLQSVLNSSAAIFVLFGPMPPTSLGLSTNSFMAFPGAILSGT